MNSSRKIEWRSIALWSVLFALGLILRVSGLLFNGMHDIDQIILEWGGNVHRVGITHTPIEIYGLLSYFFHGIAFDLALLIPRFWWAPHKFFELVFEIGTFLALVQFMPKTQRRPVIYLYWLNPWFIVHGGWYGYWDGPLTFFAMLALLALRAAKKAPLGWGTAGILLALTALFKPQGLIYFMLPVTIYLGWQWIVRRQLSSLVFFGLGALFVFGAASAILGLMGGDPLQVPNSYMIGDVMANLCNNCIGIWRPVSYLLMRLLGQSGAVYELHLPGLFSTGLDLLILASTLMLVTLFALRVSLAGATSPISPLLPNRALTLPRLIRLGALGCTVVPLVGILTKFNPFENSSLSAGALLSPILLLLTGVAVLGILIFIFAPAIAPQIERLILPILQHWQMNSVQGKALSMAPYLSAYLIIAFGALAIPQLATRAHSNHTYSGIVLLIPLAIVCRPILIAWLPMVIVHLYGQLASYQLGRSSAFPTRDVSNYPAAMEVLSLIDPNAGANYLTFQQRVNDFIGYYLPSEPVLSLMSLIQFVAVVVVIWQLFKRLGQVEELYVPRVQ